ncbi:hypothetical protein VZT92_025441 [Zoarces viviparus]|uniref:C-type lectin domain-containing protein n=1 Tax=Zoarces viviparus TaxID=48416 RepID=A0AAW1DXU0_ZOAVI
MDKLLLSIVVMSGLCAVSSERRFHLVPELKTMTEAQRHCRETYSDLATIRDMEDVNTLNTMLQSSPMVDGSSFDPGKDRWTERARMKYCWYGCGTVDLNGEIDIVRLDGHLEDASNVGAVEGELYLCRHEIITKESLEMDAADNVWTVVERRAAVHDGYDVCLVANLNPRDLITA